MQQERARVQEWLESATTELQEMTFQGLVAKVEAEKKSQELLNEVEISFISALVVSDAN